MEGTDETIFQITSLKPSSPRPHLRRLYKRISDLPADKLHGWNTEKVGRCTADLVFDASRGTGEIVGSVFMGCTYIDGDDLHYGFRRSVASLSQLKERASIPSS